MARRIYVGNLPWSYSSSDLEGLFKEYGDVAAAEVIMDRETGRSRGFGFVQMANDGDMDAAINALNGFQCGGRGGRGGYGGGGGGYGGGGGGGYGDRDRDRGQRRY